jgi:hypothetical protein
MVLGYSKDVAGLASPSSGRVSNATMRNGKLWYTIMPPKPGWSWGNGKSSNSVYSHATLNPSRKAKEEKKRVAEQGIFQKSNIKEAWRSDLKIGVKKKLTSYVLGINIVNKEKINI